MCHRFILILLLLLVAGAMPAQDATPEQARKVVSRVAPVYPDLARRMHITGVVRFRTTIAPNGSVKLVEPVGGNPVLIKAAQDALKSWRFAPSTDETREVIELRFDAR
jgi:TonB family protein